MSGKVIFLPVPLSSGAMCVSGRVVVLGSYLL